MTSRPTIQNIDNVRISVNGVDEKSGTISRKSAKRRKRGRFSDFGGPMNDPSAPFMQHFEQKYNFHADINRIKASMPKPTHSAERARKRKIREIAEACTDCAEHAAEVAEMLRRNAERANLDREQVIERVTRGWFWSPGFVGGNKRYWHGPVRVAARLPSEGSPILKLFVASTPRCVPAGDDKAHVEKHLRRVKVLALDKAYVETNKVMRRMIRVDLDGVFDPQELLTSLAALGIALPNWMVGWLHPATGRLHSPHLIWLIEHPVNFGPKGSIRAKKFFTAVLHGLTAVLAPLGADPGGLSNQFRVKNPLCPLWTVYTPCSEARNLSDLAKGLPERGAARPATKPLVAPAVDHPSNALFAELSAYARSVFKPFRSAGDRDGFRQAVIDRGFELADKHGQKRKHAGKVISNVVEWTWTNYRAGTTGRTRAEVGTAAATERKNFTLGRLLSAREIAIASGIFEPSCRDLAELAGVSRRSAERYSRHLDGDRQTNDIDKKAATHTEEVICSEGKGIPSGSERLHGVDIGNRSSVSDTDAVTPEGFGGTVIPNGFSPGGAVDHSCLADAFGGKVIPWGMGYFKGIPRLHKASPFDVLRAMLRGRNGDDKVSKLIRAPFDEWHMHMPQGNLHDLISALESAYGDESSVLHPIACELVPLVPESQWIAGWQRVA